MKTITNYFTKFEIGLWLCSVFLIVGSFFAFDQSNPLALVASLIGITALIFCAKGNPIGQVLMVAFSIIYGTISYACAYYGEMMTYLGMSLPMASFALFSWLRNPFQGNRAEVKVNRIGKTERILILPLTAAVTVLFYFILKFFHTANLPVSTFSVATSFLAVYLTFRRSPYFALAYAFNDVVLIVLWSAAAVQERRYLSVVVCFVAFLFNDLYSFYNWQRMKQRQSK